MKEVDEQLWKGFWSKLNGSLCLILLENNVGCPLDRIDRSKSLSIGKFLQYSNLLFEIATELKKFTSKVYVSLLNKKRCKQ